MNLTSEYKSRAIEILDRLKEENCINYKDYCDIRGGLDEADAFPWWEAIRPLMLWKTDFVSERDWKTICKVLNIEEKSTEVELKCFVCVQREYSRSSRVKRGCYQCEATDCCYNHDGECRFTLVHERKPCINNVDGCIDYNHQEGDA